MSKNIKDYYWKKGFVSFTDRVRNFAAQPWALGLILLSLVVLAMLLANLPFTKDLYREILETELGIVISIPHMDSFIFPRDLTIEKFINDILMVVFFFTVGLEIKRELTNGELSTPKRAIMPVIAALGGVLAPALIYFLINRGTAAAGGWGIPTATDIAFAVGILAVLRDKVPVSLKVFLTALAIADDLIAILVVAIFYGGSINVMLLGIAAVLIVLVALMNKVGEKRPWFYFIPAIAIWVLFYYSGIHATMSGVVMAFLIPYTPRYSREYFFRKRGIYAQQLDKIEQIEQQKNEDEEFPNDEQCEILRRLSKTSTDSMGLSHRLEHALGPWVNFLIMPIFALANAGVTVPNLDYFNIFQYSPEIGSVGMGIVFGLVLGKPIGITLASWIAIKAKVGSMPAKSTWPELFAVACLGGIGFTMSIFVDTLSFGDYPQYTQQLRDMGKVAVLMASLVAGLLGTGIVSFVKKENL